MPFDVERRWFQIFRDCMAQSDVVRTEMEDAIEQVFQEYDTTIRENRFIVGGVIEYIVGAAMRACGIPVRHKGVVERDVDLVLEGSGGGYSIKSLLKSTSTRLVNVLGGAPSRNRWQVATLFLLSGGSGIVYSDPALPWWQRNLDQHVKEQSDALVVGKQSIEAFASAEPKWTIRCKLPAANRIRGRPARTASGDLAAQILMHEPTLGQHLSGLRPWDEAPRGTSA